MKFREPIKISEIIKSVKENQDNEVSYCIFSKIEDLEELVLDSICYIDDYPAITDDDEEIYSNFVVTQFLSLLFREELVQDVVYNTLHQKSSATDQEILMAIKYYIENDNFMDF